METDPSRLLPYVSIQVHSGPVSLDPGFRPHFSVEDFWIDVFMTLSHEEGRGGDETVGGGGEVGPSYI